jgi:D-alanine-D-alanine ligase
MRVGLVYDLRADYEAMGLSGELVAEFDSVETIDALERAIRAHGHIVERIGNVRRLAERLARGDRWDLVFNVAEGLAGRSREAQVPALLEAFAVPFTFSDALVMALTLDKAMAKRVVRDSGVPTAPFAIVADLADLAAVDLPYPLFAKPIAEGTGKGVSPRSKAADPTALAAVCAELLDRYRQPVLVETYLPGREFTVGILGDGATAQALGVLEIELLADAEPEVYGYVNKENSEELVRYRLADDATARAAAKVALDAYRALGLLDAGRVDVRCDAAGAPRFLEVNPLPGLHPTHSDLPILAAMTGMDHSALIGAILDSAAARQGLGADATLLRAAE